MTDRWVGKAWVDTVTVESRAKVEAAAARFERCGSAALAHGQPSSSAGADMPVMYAAVKMNGDGQVVAFGRSMQPMANLQQQLVSAQQSMEREYLKLRQAEARHRLLFQVASEAVFIVDAEHAQGDRGQPGRRTTARRGYPAAGGPSVPGRLRRASTQALQGLLGAVRATGRTSDAVVTSIDGGREFRASASLFREERNLVFPDPPDAGDGRAPGVGQSQPRIRRCWRSSPARRRGSSITGLDGTDHIREPGVPRSGAAGDRRAGSQ